MRDDSKAMNILRGQGVVVINKPGCDAESIATRQAMKKPEKRERLEISNPNNLSANLVTMGYNQGRADQIAFQPDEEELEKIIRDTERDGYTDILLLAKAIAARLKGE